MTAIEMFKKLGYRCIKSDRSIWYINDSDVENYGSIEFWLCDCTFEATGNYGDPLMVNVKELEAINKQCKELGWLEEKQETNYEHYKDEIIEECYFTVALVDGKPHKCSSVKCNDCGFSTGHGCGENIKKWLKKPYEKQTYKLSRFEYDLLNTFDRCKECCLLNEIECLKKLTQKGYFKGIDPFTKVHDIIDNCEVIK